MRLLTHLKSLFKRKPKPEKPKPLWTGTCSCCGKEVHADWLPTEAQIPKLECLGCVCGLTPASEKRNADTHQVELLKRAMRELKEETF